MIFSIKTFRARHPNVVGIQTSMTIKNLEVLFASLRIVNTETAIITSVRSIADSNTSTSAITQILLQSFHHTAGQSVKSYHQDSRGAIPQQIPDFCQIHFRIQQRTNSILANSIPESILKSSNLFPPKPNSLTTSRGGEYHIEDMEEDRIKRIGCYQ